MKNLSKDNITTRKSIYLFGLLIAAFCIVAIGNAKNILFSEEINDYFPPDSIPHDSNIVADTIDVTAVYAVTDTLEIFADGLDSIIILQEDTTIYYMQTDTTVTYYIGEVAENVNFEKPNDTVAYYYATDTAAYFIPKDETIAYQLINAEATGAMRVDDAEQNSGVLKLEITSKLNTIQIAPSTITQDVPPNLHGTNIADMFGQKQEPEGFYGEDQWQILSDLAPNVIRIASGGSSMLMHLLHNPYTEANSKGYGFILEEIVQYFDNTDGQPDEINVLDTSLLNSFLAEVNPDTAIKHWTDPNYDSILDDGWLNNVTIAGNCYDYIQKYKSQELLPDTTRYLDAFIRLVKFIENDSANGNKQRNHKVKVIVALNIISETAEENKAIVRYLRNNPIYNIDVYGVELGNECYSLFYQKCMGFNSFSRYYDYLTGFDFAPYDDILRTEMVGNGHNLIYAFKSNPEFATTLKVGVTGYDNPDPLIDTFQLRKIEPEDSFLLPTPIPWNEQIGAYYFDDIIPVTGTPYSVAAFDAVIIHPYYGKENFQDELIGKGEFPELLKQIYDCVGADGGLWDTSAYDYRLKPAFDLMTNKFLSLFKTGYESSLYRWGQDLGFAADGDYGGKEIWMSEWNYKDAGKYPDPTSDVFRMTSFENTFLQGLFVFEYNLKNIKINFDNDFWNPFMPLATFHSFGGGGNTEMINFCQDEELVYYNNYPEPWMTTGKLCDSAYWYADYLDDGLKRNYYVKHTPYFATELISVIYKNNLRLLKSTFKMPKSFTGEQSNIQPTVFIDADSSNLYFFFSNAWGNNLNYKIDPIGLTGFFDGALGVELGTPLIIGLKAKFPYYTAGKCALFDYRFNTCYSNPGIPNYCTDPLPPVPYPMQLTTIDTIDALPDGCGSGVLGSNCITLPPYAFGYIKIPLLPFYEKTASNSDSDIKLILYPNPTNNYFTVNAENFVGNDELIDISIYTISGILVDKFSTTYLSQFDVSTYAAGCYVVHITNINGVNQTTLLIKN